MYWNGVVIGIVAVITAAPPNTILPVLQVGRAACTVAVAGAAARGSAAFRTVTTTARRTASTTSACASPSEVNFSFQRLLSFTPFIILSNLKLSTGLEICPPERRYARKVYRHRGGGIFICY